MSPYYRALRAALGTELLLIPSVAAVIHDEQGRLLLQRKRDGSWSLPAGAIEPGETPEQACAREVLEETGFRCVDFRMVAVLGGETFRHTYPHGDAVEYVIVVYRCEVEAAGEISDSETDYLEYFRREDMPKLALPYDLELLFQERYSMK